MSVIRLTFKLSFEALKFQSFEEHTLEKARNIKPPCSTVGLNQEERLLTCYNYFQISQKIEEDYIIMESISERS